jgi:23S rRNA (guanosine2251-2'-O)-methyltransferase
VAEILAGRNAVREALVAGRRSVHRVLLAQGGVEQGIVAEILGLCQAGGVPVTRVGRAELDRLAEGIPHQGVIAEVAPYPYASLEEILEGATGADEDPLLLILDQVQDPQNVGALLRTAEAVGVHGVIIASHRAAQISPAVSRASAGAAEHLAICTVSNIARTLQRLRDEGLWIVGIEDMQDAQEFSQADYARPLALVLGSEGSGMRRLVAKQCDYMVRIPMRGQVTSLNVSVAGAIVLYAALTERTAGAATGPQGDKRGTR